MSVSFQPVGVAPSSQRTQSPVDPARSRRWPAKAFTLPADAAALSAPALWDLTHYRGVLAFAVLTIVLLGANGRYRARLHVSWLDEFPTLVTPVLLAGGSIATVTALRHPSIEIANFLRLVLVSGVLLLVGRMVTNSVILIARRSGRVSHPAVVVGVGPVGKDLRRILDQHGRYGLRVVATVDDRVVDGDDRLVSGRLHELDEVVGRTGAEVVLVADPVTPTTQLAGLLRGSRVSRCDLLVVPRFEDFHTQAGLVDHIGAIPIMRIRTPKLNGLGRKVKRAVDILASATAILLLAPVLIACAVAVYAEGGSGVIFRQRRMTRDGVLFDVLKFRSMRPLDEGDSATRWNIADDDRIGPVGRILRRTSLDELPQLWNILRGDMTLVGPRPERPHFVAQFSAEDPTYMNRHRVPCGLTGLAQVSGLRGDTSIRDRARHDNLYIENWSLWLDLKVVVRTLGEVLGARGR